MDHELDELRREFLAEAEAKVAEMQAAIDSARSAESLAKLTYVAHQLKGSGGSYGYAKISSEAAELEQAVDTLIGGSTDERLESQIQQHVVNLRDEIGRRTKEIAPSATT